MRIKVLGMLALLAACSPPPPAPEQPKKVELPPQPAHRVGIPIMVTAHGKKIAIWGYPAHKSLGHFESIFRNVNQACITAPQTILEVVLEDRGRWRNGDAKYHLLGVGCASEAEIAAYIKFRSS